MILTFRIFCLLQLSCRPSVASFTFMNLNFEVVIFLPICARKQAKHNKRMVERQMIKVLARPNNFVDKEKVANLNETLHKILRFLM